MKFSRLSSLTAIALATALVSNAHATQVTGKGGSCSAIWDSGTAAVSVSTTGKPSLLACNDGDPTCDSDGQPNGVCRIDLSACAGVAVGSCTPGTLTTLKFNGPARNVGIAAPAFGTCGGGVVLALPLKRGPTNPSKPLKKLKPSKKTVLVMKSKGFLNKLAVQCLPPGVGSCPLRTDDPTAPSQITLTTPVATTSAGNGSDLDNGWTGTSHNFPVIGGSKLTYCLSGCNGKTSFQCNGIGTTKLGTGDATNPIVNGLTFGAPLPLLTTGVPVCVINRYQDPQLTGMFNLQTGEAGSATSPNEVKLFSDVWLRTKFPGEVCPRCNVAGGNGAIGSTGTCSSSASNAGAPCRVDGEVNVAGGGQNPYLLSSDCSPLGDNPQPNGTLDIRLEFTTGSTSLAGPLPCKDSAGPQTQDDNCGSGSCTATCTGSACAGTNAKGECIDAKGGISQLCCSTNTATPCFPTKGGGSITRTGAPGTNGQTMVNATTFCIARTQSTLINATTGLPGPGALLLPGDVKVTP